MPRITVCLAGTRKAVHRIGAVVSRRRCETRDAGHTRHETRDVRRETRDARRFRCEAGDARNGHSGRGRGSDEGGGVEIAYLLVAAMSVGQAW
jgi:hypothetical protein